MHHEPAAQFDVSTAGATPAVTTQVVHTLGTVTISQTAVLHVASLAEVQGMSTQRPVEALQVLVTAVQSVFPAMHSEL